MMARELSGEKSSRAICQEQVVGKQRTDARSCIRRYIALDKQERQETVEFSTFEAEYLVFHAASMEGAWLLMGNYHPNSPTRGRNGL